MSSRVAWARVVDPRRRGHWTLLALLAGCAAGCDLPGRPRTGDRFRPPQQETRFSALFHQNCAGCHGRDGTSGPAPPLNDELFLALIPDRELHAVIAAGRTGTLMPAFATSEGGHLTAEQVDVLTAGIKRQWGSPKSAPSGAPEYLIATSTSEGAATKLTDAGIRAFARACASCHGDHGQGGRYGGTPAGKSVGAINDPDLLGLLSDQALRRYVITGRPDLGMPAYADPTGRPEGFQPLSSEDVANVLAVLAEWRQGGAVEGKGD